jgi:hypothetical protein
VLDHLVTRLFEDGHRSSPLRREFPPVRPGVGADNPAGRADHAGPEGPDQNRIVPSHPAATRPHGGTART